ncbi:hypothetical protein [Pseudolysinimonas sp.]|uniref:hypothetical protein n=1 Tax=Pseudolysinimonas sp. TaxID=2680009 RepID=UPI003F7EF10C
MDASRPDPDRPPARDETRLTEQPSLTFSTGRIWLIVGGFFTAIALGVLVPQALLGLPPVGLPLVAAVLVGVLYALMYVVRFAVPVTRLRRRLGWMAVLMLAIAVVSLATVIVVAFSSWNAAG